MTTEQISNGLKQLGFNTGWVVSGGEIILWENAEPQPSVEEIEAAFAQYNDWKAEQDAAQAAKKAAAEAKLAALGLTAEDLQALGLGGN